MNPLPTAAARQAAIDRQKLLGRAYQRAMGVLRARYPDEYSLNEKIARVLEQPTSQYQLTCKLREKYRAEFDAIRESIYLELAGENPEPTEEEQEAALASIREAMTELSTPPPEDPIVTARREAMDWLHGTDRPGGLDGRFANVLALTRALIQEADKRIAKSESRKVGQSESRIHDALLAYLEELGVEMPSADAFPMISDPDARSYVRDQVLVAAVLAHHLGTSIEECLGVGVAC